MKNYTLSVLAIAVCCLIFAAGFVTGKSRTKSTTEVWAGNPFGEIDAGYLIPAPSAKDRKWDTIWEVITPAKKKPFTKYKLSESSGNIVVTTTSGWTWGTVATGDTDTATAYSHCSSAVWGDGWNTMRSAPKDGTVVELAQTMGVAPWYGLFKWTDRWWQSASDEGRGMVEDCAYWRPYVGDVASYRDPTQGAQNSVKYWCDSMHRGYDPKKDACK